MDNNMDNFSFCRKCNTNKIGAEPLDQIFRLNCDECTTYRTEKARTKWIIRSKAILYPCRPCWTSYRLKQPLVTHKCSREDVFTCTECGQQLYSEEDLSKHTKYVHELINPGQQCGMCGVMVVNLGHHDCATDNQRCEMPNSSNSGDKVVKEETAPLKSSKEFLVVSVSTKHTKTKDKPYKSEICTKSFSNLKTHIHPWQNPKKCAICMKGFIYPADLKRHMNSHTGEKPYKCKICMKGFSYPSTLKEHINTHTGEKPYKCKICKRGFARSSTLKQHINTHTGEKPYKCKICMKGFTFASALKPHMNTHTGEKPYKCKICTKGFAHYSNLKQHINTHTGEKPYKCKICMKGFTFASALKPHMNTHTGEKPYKCKICTKGFTQSSNLKSHMNTHSV